jgi:hypothetical protein
MIKGYKMADIKIKNARLSFPSLFNKSVFNGKEGKYEATLLFPKTDTATYELIMAEIEKCKTESKVKVPDSKLFIKDGDEVFEEKGYDGYEGMWAVKAGNTKRPTVIDGSLSPITENDDVIYAGCYVNALISCWAQNNEFGKRINANLLGVQFAKDGDAFGGDAKVASANDFDALDEL